MKSAWGTGGILATLLMAVVPAHAVEIDLFEYALNINDELFGTYGEGVKPGEGTEPPIPGVDLSDFDAFTGLGTIRVSTMGDSDGRAYVSLFVDHDIGSDFFNETGAAEGKPASSQTWEIDEPGFQDDPDFHFGDIFDNFLDSMLDSQVFESTLDNKGGPDLVDDVSMALAWELSGFKSKELRFDFIVSQTAPSGFHLAQRDPDTDTGVELFFSSRFSVIPEPTTLALLALGLAGLGFAGGRRHRAGAEGS